MNSTDIFISEYLLRAFIRIHIVKKLPQFNNVHFELLVTVT